jgi:hypothetical protein
MTEAPSYHDLHVTTADIPRTSIFSLPYSLRVTCCRVAGWELWRVEDGWTLLAGEYAVPGQWLVLDVNGTVIVDSRRPQAHEAWCGDASLSRPAGECTCAITPEMQAQENAETDSDG